MSPEVNTAIMGPYELDAVLTSGIESDATRSYEPVPVWVIVPVMGESMVRFSASYSCLGSLQVSRRVSSPVGCARCSVFSFLG